MFTQLLFITTLTLAISTPNSGSNMHNPVDDNNYQLSLIKGCQVIAQIPMSADQTKHYLALKQLEEDMHQLEQPLIQFEQQSKQLAHEIEHLNALAVQETEDNLHIDEQYLAQQQEAAIRLDVLVNQYQADFDALAAQGDLMSATAEEFEQAIKPSLAGMAFEQIQVSSVGVAADTRYCQQ